MNFKNELNQILAKFSQKNKTSLLKDKDVYAEWLAQTYFFVRHSTSLLGYALPYLKNDGLRHHFEHHMREEDRHDLLAIKDIQKLGYDIKNFTEFSQTQSFYHSQYYRISFEGGTSLLGYILFLEGMAVTWGKESYEEIKALFPGATLFLKVHAEEDPHHLDEAFGAIAKLTVSEQEAILRNLNYSYESYQAIIDRAVETRFKVKVA